MPVIMTLKVLRKVDTNITENWKNLRTEEACLCPLNCREGQPYTPSTLCLMEVCHFKASLLCIFANSIDICEEMEVSKELMKNLLLAAGGSGGTSIGGGGFYCEFTNWNRTKMEWQWNQLIIKWLESCIPMQKETFLYRQFELYAILHGFLP